MRGTGFSWLHFETVVVMGAAVRVFLAARRPAQCFRLLAGAALSHLSESSVGRRREVPEVAFHFLATLLRGWERALPDGGVKLRVELRRETPERKVCSQQSYCPSDVEWQHQQHVCGSRAHYGSPR